jgi:hypothetical protein
MLRKANNVFSVLLNDGLVATSGMPAVGTVVTPANLPAGAVVLVDAGMRRMSNTEYAALANDGNFFIVQGRGTSKSLMKSPILTKGKVKFSIAKHKETVQQVSAIGYNGTTGALPVANNTDFWIKIRKRDNDAANRSQPFSLFAGPVKTDSTGTQEELAFALVISGLKNFKDEPANHYLKFEALCAGTQADWTGTATHLSLTNGSKIALFTDNTGAPSTATAPTVGGIVRILGVAYKITASSTTSITLNYAYQGDTGLVAGGTTAATQAGIVASPGDYGVRLTGIQAPFDVNQFRDFYANRFTPTFSDSTTLVTHLQGAYNGNGMWEQVAMDEYMSYGYEGEMQQLAVPSVPRDQFVKIPGIGTNTALTSKYSCLNIAWEESISGLVSMDGGKGNVVVYLNLANSGGSGILPTTPDNCGETFVVALGLTASAFNE